MLRRRAVAGGAWNLDWGGRRALKPALRRCGPALGLLLTLILLPGRAQGGPAQAEPSSESAAKPAAEPGESRHDAPEEEAKEEKEPGRAAAPAATGQGGGALGEDSLAEALRAAAAAAEAAREAAEAARAAAEASRRAAEALAGKAEATSDAQETPTGAQTGDEGAKKETPAGPSAWSYQLGLSFISVTGNANAVTGKVSGLASGSWAKWRVKFEGGGAYGQATNGLSEVTALNGNLSARGDRRLGPKFTVYLTGGLATDHVASIELQYFGEPGLSLLWWEEKEAKFVRSSLQTDLGFRLTRESRFQYFPVPRDLDDKDIYAPRLALSFRYALTRRAVFTEEAEILPDIVDTKNVRATSTSTLTAQIVEGVGITVSFKVRHIGAPAEGKVPTDTELAAGVSWTF
ncbi:MAG: DUF481 domain-containing protein [Deltaproteobacteria bacterium]|nr:MAG: DUF481 domain-containing protein [Deltaproteobacteria bacterium]